MASLVDLGSAIWMFLTGWMDSPEVLGMHLTVEQIVMQYGILVAALAAAACFGVRWLANR